MRINRSSATSWQSAENRPIRYCVCVEFLRASRERNNTPGACRFLIKKSEQRGTRRAGNLLSGNFIKQILKTPRRSLSPAFVPRSLQINEKEQDGRTKRCAVAKKRRTLKEREREREREKGKKRRWRVLVHNVQVHFNHRNFTRLRET